MPLIVQLPLLGSNQDSPDPESATSPAFRVDAEARSRQFAPVADSSHTKSHTISHLRGVVVCCLVAPSEAVKG